MAELPVVTPREAIRALEHAGFERKRQKGSHLVLQRESVRVTVPVHKKDMARGTLRAIIRDAGLTVDEFCEHLNA